MKETENTSPATNHLRALIRAVALLLVAVAGVFILNLILLLLLKMFWGLYRETYIGSYFQGHFHLLSYYINYLSQRPILDFSLKVTLFSLATVLPVAILMQLFHVRQWLYMNLALHFRLLWAVALTLAVAYFFRGYAALSTLNLAYAVVLPSVLCLMPVCLRTSSELFPSLVAIYVQRQQPSIQEDEKVTQQS